MEFIKGKWYRNSEWRDNAYCKADGSRVHGKIYFTECIDNDEHTYKLDWWQNREGTIREVALEEIQQWLPYNHPDKIKPIEKWSVGSYVVFLKNFGRSNKGDIDLITKDVNHGNVVICEKEIATTKDEQYVKWFATKSEAEEFAKSLVEIKESKPKQLTVDDLVEGEIYTDGDAIFIAPNKNNTGLRITTQSFVNRNSKFDLEDCLRPATPQEKKHLNVCIQQDKFINQEDLDLYDDVTFELKTLMKEEPKYSYEVVHCTTQEEWDFVAKVLGRTTSVSFNYFGDCIRLNNPECSEKLTYCKNDNNCKIYSFQEWCNKFNHKPDFMNKQEPERKQPSMEELLEEARRRFPIGSTFKLIPIYPGDGLKTCKVSNYAWLEGDIDSNGNYLYYKGKWAEIISLPEKIEEEWKPCVGDWVTIEDSDKLENGCMGCPKGTFIVVENADENYVQGLLRTDENTFIVKISNTPFRYWRISNKGVKKAKPHEIPVQEDEFVLPERWCFRVTKENYQKFKHLRQLIDPTIGYITSQNYEGKSWGLWSGEIYGVEITFEQFQKCVLNSTLGIKEYPITPQECIPTTKPTGKQVCLSNFNEETTIKINFKQTIKI